MQQYAGVYLLQNYSTCFGCLSHPSSGVHQTVSAASGAGRSVRAKTIRQRGLIRSRWRKVILLSRHIFISISSLQIFPPSPVFIPASHVFLPFRLFLQVLYSSPPLSHPSQLFTLTSISGNYKSRSFSLSLQQQLLSSLQRREYSVEWSSVVLSRFLRPDTVDTRTEDSREPCASICVLSVEVICFSETMGCYLP